MVDLNNLGLVDEPIHVSLDDMPKEYNPGEALAQPGIYTFQIPQVLSQDAFQPFQTAKGQRLRIVFKGGDALRILPSQQTIPYASIHNEERAYGKDKKLVSDLAFLLRSLRYEGNLSNNSDYAKGVANNAGAKFQARLSWQTSCNAKKDIYANGAVQFGIKGCGQRFEEVARVQKNGTQVLSIPRDNGLLKDRFECTCENHALLKVFPVLNAFKAVV